MLRVPRNRVLGWGNPHLSPSVHVWIPNWKSINTFKHFLQVVPGTPLPTQPTLAVIPISGEEVITNKMDVDFENTYTIYRHSGINLNCDGTIDNPECTEAYTFTDMGVAGGDVTALPGRDHSRPE
jgi:hypothetical protein